MQSKPEQRFVQHLSEAGSPVRRSGVLLCEMCRAVRDPAGHYQAEHEKPFLVPPAWLEAYEQPRPGPGAESSTAGQPAGSGGRQPPVSLSPFSNLSRPGPLPLRQHVPAPCRRGCCQTGAQPPPPPAGARPAARSARPWQQPSAEESASP